MAPFISQAGQQAGLEKQHEAAAPECSEHDGLPEEAEGL